MSQTSWENVLVNWVNCLSLQKNHVEHIGELKDGLFFFNLLNILNKSSQCSEAPANVLEMINNFLKSEYPGFYIEDGQNEENIISLCSLFLFHSVFKAESMEVMEKMCNLNSDIQIYIRNFLQRLLLHKNIINQNILQEVISEHNNFDAKSFGSESFSKDSSPIMAFSSTPKRKSRVLESPIAQQMKLSEQKLQISRLKNELEQEQAEKSEMQECIRELESRIKQLQHQLNQKNCKIKELHDERYEVFTSPKKGEPLHEVMLKEEVKTLEKCISTLQQEISAMQEEKDSLTMKLAKLEGQCLFWQTKAKESIANSELLKEELKEKEQHLNNLREACEDLQNYIQEMKPARRSRRSSDFDFLPVGKSISPASCSAETLDKVIDLQLQEKVEENIKLKETLQTHIKEAENFQQEVRNFEEQLKEVNSDLMKKVEELATAEEKCVALHSEVTNKDLELSKHICASDKLKTDLNELQQRYQELHANFNAQNANFIQVKNDAEETKILLEEKSYECTTLLQENLESRKRIEFVEQELNKQMKAAICMAETEYLEKSEVFLEHVDMHMENCVEKLNIILDEYGNKISKTNEEILKLKLTCQKMEENSAVQCSKIEKLYAQISVLEQEKISMKNHLEGLMSLKEEENKFAKERIAELNQNLESLTFEHYTKVEELIAVKAEFEVIKQNLENTLQDVLEKQGIIDELLEMKESTSLQVNELKNELSSLKHELESARLDSEQIKEKKESEVEMLMKQRDEGMKNLERAMAEAKEERNNLQGKIKALELQNKELMEQVKDMEVINNSLQETKSKLASTLNLKTIAEESNSKLEAVNAELKMSLKLCKENEEKLKEIIEEHTVQHKSYEEMCIKLSQEKEQMKECFRSIALMETKLEGKKSQLCRSLDELAINFEVLASDMSVAYSKLITVHYQQAELQEVFGVVQIACAQISQKIRDMKYTAFERIAECAKMQSTIMYNTDSTTSDQDSFHVKHISYKEILRCEDLKPSVHGSIKELKSEMSDIISVLEILDKKCNSLISKCQCLHKSETSLLLDASLRGIRNLMGETKLKCMKSMIENIRKQEKKETELDTEDDGWNPDDSLEVPRGAGSSAEVFGDEYSLFPSLKTDLNLQRKAAFNVRIKKELNQISGKMNILKTQNESLKLFLQREQNLNSELKRNLVELETSKNIIISEKEAALAEKTKLESRISDLEISKNAIISEKEAALTEKTKLKSRISDLEVSKNAIISEKEAALSEKTKLESRISDLEISKNAIKREKEVALAEKIKLESRISDLEISKNAIISEKEAALAEKIKLKSRISDLEVDLLDLNSCRADVSQLKEKCKMLGLTCDELKSQLANKDCTQGARNLKYTEEDMTKRIDNVRIAYEAKLEKLKLKMKFIFDEEFSKKTGKLKEEISRLQVINKLYKEKIASYGENLKILQSQEWEIGDRYLVAKEENKHYEDMIKASKHISLISSGDQAGNNRMEAIAERKHNVPVSGHEQQKTNISVLHSMDVIDESIMYTRRQSVYKSLPSGMLFSAEDEEGEEFNTTNLADLKAGRCQPPAVEGYKKARLSELQLRNSLCPPHLKSSYPAETQFYDPRDYKDEDLKLGCAVDIDHLNSLSTSMLLPGEKHHKKDIGKISYMRPGPPTPGKNCRRHSLQGAECLTPRAPLRESNDGASVRRAATPSRLLSLFSKTNRRNNENSPRTRRISNLFRKPLKNNH